MALRALLKAVLMLALPFEGILQTISKGPFTWFNIRARQILRYNVLACPWRFGLL